MSAPHFFVASIGDGDVVLDGDDARHAVGSLRIRAGERITVSDGKGCVAGCVVDDADARALVARQISRRSVPRPSPRVVAFPALAKSDKLELVVQKLVELGVDEIRPYPAARSIVRWDEAKAARNVARWRAIAREAAMQSRRAWLPVVEAPRAPDALPSLCVVLHEEASDMLRDALPPEAPEEIGVVIGPEGGLAPDELAAFERMGARIVSLGTQILRTETAAIVGPALVLAAFGRLG